MTYSELVAKLEKIEREHGVYLFDQSVDAENIGKPTSEITESEWFEAAASAAGMRAENAGLDINALVGKVIY